MSSLIQLLSFSVFIMLNSIITTRRRCL